MKWFPTTKGGGFRRWYGNMSYVVNWENDGEELSNFKGSVIRNRSRYFTKCGSTWSTIASGKPSFRYFSKSWLFETKGSVCFPENEADNNFIMGYLNSPLVTAFLTVLAPTLDYHEGPVGRIPYKETHDKNINNLVKANITISKQDWDSHETSWDFQRNELLSLVGDVSHVATCSNANQTQCGETPHLLRFVNKKEYIYITGNKLPHWNQGDCVQFVTFRLADSLPQTKLDEYGSKKEQWLAEHPKPWNADTKKEYEEKIGNVVDKWIDAGYGECILKDERVRNVVANAILHFNGERYDIHAFVIMPNHVHVLLSTRGDNLVQDIVGSWKKFSAHEINKMLNRQGAVWERESFDHMVRDADSYQAKLSYIVNNPASLPSDYYTLVGDVSHVANAEMPTSTLCGETPHPLNVSLKDLVNRYKQKWEHKFAQLHANEEELNRQFIHIYGLEDELTPDVPLDEITILQQGEISIE